MHSMAGVGVEFLEKDGNNRDSVCPGCLSGFFAVPFRLPQSHGRLKAIITRKESTR